MTRRTAPKKQMDEAAFPLRLCIKVPENGFGRTLMPMQAWLDDRVGRGNYAWHSHGSRGWRDTAAVYFRSAQAAVEFCQAWPDLELSDAVGTMGSPEDPMPPGCETDEAVCNLYTQTRSQDAMRQIFKGLSFTDRIGNLEPGPVYPNRLASIVRHDTATGGLELVMARWGMPSPPAVLKTARDPGVTNVRNLQSSHWRRWLGPAHRCLVPVTAFAEPVVTGPWKANRWFALAEADDQPMFFAGIETRAWRSVRRVKDGETEDDLYAFLTCPPSAEVAVVHPRAMPVILTQPREWELWMSAPVEVAMTLQRPLPDGSLRTIDGPV